MFSKTVLVLSIVLFANAKDLQIQNSGGNNLKVSVSGQNDISLLAGQNVVVTVADNWSGSISAVRDSCTGACNVRTKAEISLGGAQDKYDVSLINGFNLGIKVVPINSVGNCDSAVCAARITSKCPVADQVRNSLGKVVACRNSPVVFRTLCPQAVVSSADTQNVLACNAASYLVLIG